FDAMPLEMRANALAFIETTGTSHELLGRVGQSQTEEIPAIDYQKRLDNLVIESPVAGSLVTLESKMGIMFECLQRVLPANQISTIKSAYNDAQRNLFDTGHINNFIHTTTKGLGLTQQVTIGSGEVLILEPAEYSVMRVF